LYADWIPYIKNYSRIENMFGAQNWAIDEASSGWLYVSNMDGIIMFDGNAWQKCLNVYSRSVMVSDSGRIYFGGYNTFGYLELGEDGKYHSGYYRPDVGNFSDIWNIFELDSTLYFVSYNYVFKVKDTVLSVIESQDKISCSLQCDGTGYLYLDGVGLAVLSGNQIIRLPGAEELASEKIVSMVPYGKGQILLVCESGKVFIYSDGKVTEFPFNTELFIRNSQAYCAAAFNSTLFIGTIHSGLFVIDMETGKCNRISTEVGLQNNSVHRIHVNSEGNVWLSLDNGISYIDFKAPLTTLYPSAKYGRGYTAHIQGNNFYFGTNIGVFLTDWPIGDTSKLHVKQIEGLNSQIWTLNTVGDDIICGSNIGAFSIEKGKAVTIDSSNGYFSFCKVPGHEDLILGGTYTGVNVLTKSQGKWNFGWKVKGFNESCVRMLYDTGKACLWISSNGRTKRLSLSADMQEFISVEESDSAKRPYLKDGKVVLDTLGRDVILCDEFGSEWYMLKGRLYRDFKLNGKWQTDSLVSSLMANNTVPSFQKVLSADKQSSIINTIDGISKYDVSNFSNAISNPFRFNIREFSLSSSKENFQYYFDYTDDAKSIARKIRFSPEGVYKFRVNTSDSRYKYTYQLVPVTSEPLKINENGVKEFTGLKEGKYTLHAWVTDPISGKTETDSLSFTIRPPWHRSIIADLIYLLIIALICWYISISIFRYSKRKTKAQYVAKLIEDAKNEERLKNEVLQHEKTILALQNENLQESIRLKSNEISNSMLNILQNQDLLSSILYDTQKIAKQISDSKIDAASHTTHQLMDKVKESLETKESWKVLEDNFNIVHHDFISRIKEAYPQLNYNDIKLAVYIRMNLLTKEIAPLMGISERGLESARFRLRHKLNLSKSERLSDFLYKF